MSSFGHATDLIKVLREVELCPKVVVAVDRSSFISCIVRDDMFGEESIALYCCQYQISKVLTLQEDVSIIPSITIICDINMAI